MEATFTNWYEPVNFTSAKVFLLVADDLTDSYWEALDVEETEGFAFICIEHLYPEVLGHFINNLTFAIANNNNYNNNSKMIISNVTIVM